MDKYLILQKHFGYSAFLDGQEQLIDAILDGRDVFGIMPTGGGKSLCYQIPTLLLPGLTFVVSPLISLMQDQVTALKEAGIPAAYVNSSLSAEQMRKVYFNIQAGKYKIVYVAPERLETESFLRLAENLSIDLLAVDEAHCIRRRFRGNSIHTGDLTRPNGSDSQWRDRTGFSPVSPNAETVWLSFQVYRSETFF